MLIAIRKLQSRKAAGTDGIMGELIKWVGDCVVDCLVKLSDVLFDDGIFPEDRAESIILPLFKKGTVHDPCYDTETVFIYSQIVMWHL